MTPGAKDVASKKILRQKIKQKQQIRRRRKKLKFKKFISDPLQGHNYKIKNKKNNIYLSIG